MVRREVRTCAFVITGGPQSSSSGSNTSSIVFPSDLFLMNRPRDSKGRYVRTSSQNLIKIPTYLYEGRNNPTINSTERYQRTHIGSSSTWIPKEFIGETIDDEEILARNPKDPISEEVQEGQPLEILNPPLVQKPENTTFSLVGDSNFVNFIDPA